MPALKALSSRSLFRSLIVACESAQTRHARTPSRAFTETSETTALQAQPLYQVCNAATIRELTQHEPARCFGCLLRF